MQWFDRKRVCRVELQCMILSPQAFPRKKACIAVKRLILMFACHGATL